jgi:hypothetical protein
MALHHFARNESGIAGAGFSTEGFAGADLVAGACAFSDRAANIMIIGVFTFF